MALFSKRDYLMICSRQLTNGVVYEMWGMILFKFSVYGLFSGQFYRLFHHTQWKSRGGSAWRPADGMRGNYPSLQMNPGSQLDSILTTNTFKAPLSFHLPWLLFLFFTQSPPRPFFNKTGVILYTFLSLIQ